MTFPDAMIDEIFSRLPVKSLCRFKCVSKFCRSCIERPEFIEEIRVKTPLKRLFHNESRNSIESFSIDVNGYATHVHSYIFENITESFKLGYGLVCYMDGDFGCCVYNLTTNEGILLPEWCKEFELCFDPSSKKYKILGWRDDNNILDFRVLTLEKDLSWRPVENTLRIRSLSDTVTAVDGKLFWCVGRKIISFDPANEKFRDILLPVDVRENKGSEYSIFEFEGSLALVELQLEQQGEEEPSEHEEEPSESSFNLWILKDVDGSNIWNLVRRNIIVPLEGTTLFDDPEIWPLDNSRFSSRGSEILITISDFDGNENYVLFYSPLNDQFRLMTIDGPNYCSFEFWDHVENHISLEELE